MAGPHGPCGGGAPCSPSHGGANQQGERTNRLGYRAALPAEWQFGSSWPRRLEAIINLTWQETACEVSLQLCTSPRQETEEWLHGRLAVRRELPMRPVPGETSDGRFYWSPMMNAAPASTGCKTGFRATCWS
jgi:hypothetical protein